MRRLSKIIISVLIILSNISCDQITKDQARDHICEQEVIHVIEDNFILTKVENTGAALSLGENLSPNLKILLLQIMPILVLVFMFVYVVRERTISKINVLAFSFIIGGGIGNIYDRILYGSVTDFMYLELGSWHTGIFNMADVSVVIGTALLLINLLILELNKYHLKVNW